MYIISLAYGKFTQLIDAVIYLCILLKIVFLLLNSKNTHSGGGGIFAVQPYSFYLSPTPLKIKLKICGKKGEQ